IRVQKLWEKVWKASEIADRERQKVAENKDRAARLEELLTTAERFGNAVFESKEMQNLPTTTPSNKGIGSGNDLAQHSTKNHQDQLTMIPTLLLRGHLRPYQHVGMHWLARLYYTVMSSTSNAHSGVNGILADEMGLGKTVQTIAVFCHLAAERGIWGPHLVVVPTAVLHNWEAELRRWAPGLKTLVYLRPLTYSILEQFIRFPINIAGLGTLEQRNSVEPLSVVKIHSMIMMKELPIALIHSGSPDERRRLRDRWTTEDAFHVCVVSYNVVCLDIAHFRRLQWEFLVLDEAHVIRNYKSQKWTLLLPLVAQARLLLTGTPLQNDLLELWAFLHFLMPHVFVSISDFREWFNDPLVNYVESAAKREEAESGERLDVGSFLTRTKGKVGAESNPLVARLHRVLRPFILRRLKKDVEKELPRKLEHVVPCPLSRRQQFLYDEFMTSTSGSGPGGKRDYLGRMHILMQLRKVCNHPDLFEARKPKLPFAMREVIRMVVPKCLAMGFTTQEDAYMSAQSESWARGSEEFGCALFSTTSSRWTDMERSYEGRNTSDTRDLLELEYKCNKVISASASAAEAIQEEDSRSTTSSTKIPETFRWRQKHSSFLDIGRLCSEDLREQARCQLYRHAPVVVCGRGGALLRGRKGEELGGDSHQNLQDHGSGCYLIPPSLLRFTQSAPNLRPACVIDGGARHHSRCPAPLQRLATLSSLWLTSPPPSLRSSSLQDHSTSSSTRSCTNIRQDQGQMVRFVYKDLQLAQAEPVKNQDNDIVDISDPDSQKLFQTLARRNRATDCCFGTDTRKRIAFIMATVENGAGKSIINSFLLSTSAKIGPRSMISNGTSNAGGASRPSVGKNVGSVRDHGTGNPRGFLVNNSRKQRVSCQQAPSTQRSSTSGAEINMEKPEAVVNKRPHEDMAANESSTIVQSKGGFRIARDAGNAYAGLYVNDRRFRSLFSEMTSRRYTLTSTNNSFSSSGGSGSGATTSGGDLSDQAESIVADRLHLARLMQPPEREQVQRLHTMFCAKMAGPQELVLTCGRIVRQFESGSGSRSERSCTSSTTGMLSKARKKLPYRGLQVATVRMPPNAKDDESGRLAGTVEALTEKPSVSKAIRDMSPTSRAKAEQAFIFTLGGGGPRAGRGWVGSSSSRVEKQSMLSNAEGTDRGRRSAFAFHVDKTVTHGDGSSKTTSPELKSSITSVLSPGYLCPLSLTRTPGLPSTMRMADSRSLILDCGKLQVLSRLLRQCAEKRFRVLLFTQFSKMLDLLEQFLSSGCMSYLRLDGATVGLQRHKLVDRFNEDENIFLMLASTRAGGVGINLTGANVVIFYDSDWNPAVDRQAMDRVHRIGQTKDVHVFRLLSSYTVEENIWRKQVVKRKLDDMVIDEGEFQHLAKRRRRG
ncbi:unnamed protein product, partial [Amoebophrya sp. A25]